MYTLYYEPGTASMLVHLMLLECAAPHRLHRVDFARDEQHSAQYLALNPTGQVPTLVIDGVAIGESAALLMSLCDRHPEAGLAPAPGTIERDRWYRWIVYLSNTLQATFRFWFYPRDLGRDQHDPATRKALRQRIEDLFTHINAELERHGPYLLGPRCSAPDLQLTMLMRWSRNMPRPALEWPALRRLADLVRARPSWQRLYQIEGLTEWQ